MTGAEKSTRHGMAGFTLLETLVALSILALAFSSLFGTFSTGLRAVRTSESYVAALNLAQSLLADRTSSREYRLGSERGTNGNLAWSVRVDRADRDVASQDRDELDWTLFRVSVRVAWSRNRDIRLETLRLGKPRERDRDDRL